MSIVTKHGDRGETGLVGGVRASKASLRVEAYGAVDELNSQIGLARAICEDDGAGELLRSIQRELFAVGGELATPAPRPGQAPAVTAAMVERPTAEVRRIEAIEGMLGDWAIPGEHAASARPRRRAGGLPAGGAAGGAARGIGRGGPRRPAGVPEPALRPVVDCRPADRGRGGRRRGPADRGGGRPEVVARMVRR